MPFIATNEQVIVGLPDTIWFPENGFCALREDALSFLLFPVEHPEFFDAVETDEDGAVRGIQVKQLEARTKWVWGAFGMPARVLTELHELWVEREHSDEYMGTLVNSYIAKGGKAYGVRAGEAYVDVGTLHGYREAIKTLSAMPLTGLQT
jgi:NDP-sugar pyrophosphorylase family protein